MHRYAMKVPSYLKAKMARPYSHFVDHLVDIALLDIDLLRAFVKTYQYSNRNGKQTWEISLNEWMRDRFQQVKAEYANTLTNLQFVEVLMAYMEFARDSRGITLKFMKRRAPTSSSASLDTLISNEPDAQQEICKEPPRPLAQPAPMSTAEKVDLQRSASLSVAAPAAYYADHRYWSDVNVMHSYVPIQPEEYYQRQAVAWNPYYPQHHVQSELVRQQSQSTTAFSTLLHCALTDTPSELQNTAVSNIFPAHEPLQRTQSFPVYRCKEMQQPESRHHSSAQSLLGLGINVPLKSVSDEPPLKLAPLIAQSPREQHVQTSNLNANVASKRNMLKIDNLLS